MSASESERLGWAVLLEQVRQGDDRAIETFVARYTPLLHETLPVHGVDRQLQRHLESGDLVQSTLWSALQALRAGEGEFRDEAELLNYLRTIGRNERRGAARHLRRKKRDTRRTLAGEEAGLDGVPATGETPSKIVSQQEQLDRLAAEAQLEDLSILQQRAEGVEWQELAGPRRTTAEALRKRIERVRKTLREALGGPEGD